MTGIQKTTDYSMFKTIKGNRPVSLSHVNELISSISKRNYLEQNPIIVNEQMEVVDGQHRLMAAKANKLPIYYIVVERASIEDVRHLNAVNRPWKMQEYIDSFAALGNQHYLWLRQFMESYQLSASAALAFIYGSTSGEWRGARIKQGLFEVTEKQKEVATSRADVLWELRPYIKRKGLMPKAFIQAIVNAYDEGKGKKLIDGVKSRGKEIYPAALIKDANRQLSSLMN